MAADYHFPTTSWSLVLAAGKPASAQAALERLCAVYWPPVFAFVRRQGHHPEMAKDLTQAFFLRLLEKHSFAAAAADRGRFRSFLLACIKNFLANEWDRDHAQRRGGGQAALPFDFDDSELALPAEPADPLTPERLFERRWAETVLQRAFDSLRQESESAGKLDLFDRLKPLISSDREGASQRGLAVQFGMTEGALKMAILRLRRRYRQILEAEICATLQDPADLDSEIRHLFAALNRP